ncbi:MAG: PilZ domain-containing protein [Spirochaetaceae bacterium]|nr:PilZ domain-containing protein [Spirochaetaceae bacterium]
MGTLTQQKIQDYYDEFKNIPVTFNKEIIQVTGLQVKQIILKCGSDFYPCFLYSTTFEEAKIIASDRSGVIKKLKEANNLASLKFTFKIPESGEQVVFLVTAHATGCAPYDNSNDTFMITLKFSQRPPDDLIGIVGRILEANVNSSKRKDERIVINPETLRKLYFATKDVGIMIEGVPRRCILRDISFGGAHLITMGISKFLIEKRASIKFDFIDPTETYSINGKFIAVESVLDRNDLVVVDMAYDEPVPMTYKVRLNNYLSTVRTIPAAVPAAPAVKTEPPNSTADEVSGGQK